MKKLLVKQFHIYKDLVDETLNALSEEQFLTENNLVGFSIENLIIDFAESIKSIRKNPGEDFKLEENIQIKIDGHIFSKSELISIWDENCEILMSNLNQLSTDDFHNRDHTTSEKLEKSIKALTYFSYQVGQIISFGNILRKANDQPSELESQRSLKEKHQDDHIQIQQNSSPVCFAKSDEVRDDYKI